MTRFIISSVLVLTASFFAVEEHPSSPIAFRVSKLLWRVSGTFDQFDYAIHIDDQYLNRAQIYGTANVASIDTGNGTRDEHLQAPSWFDGAQHPVVFIQSIAIRWRAPGQYEGTFIISIKGKSREMTIPFLIQDQVLLAEFSVSLTDFGLGAGPTSAIVGDTVDVYLQLPV